MKSFYPDPSGKRNKFVIDWMFLAIWVYMSIIGLAISGGVLVVIHFICKYW